MNHGQKGFTIVELMIATSVFALVLIMCTIAMLQIGRTYYKGITSSRTQEAAREIVDEVARAIQYGSGRPEALVAGGNTGYCIGNTRYSYDLDWQVADNPNTSQNQSRHALVADEVACAAAPPLPVAPSPPANPFTNPAVGENPRELINTRMRLMRFEVAPLNPSDPTSNLYRIRVRVVSGDNDLLTSDHMNCSSQRAGGQFCAVSELSTVVQKRVE